MRAGVKGYFEFIQLDRYRNLKGLSNPYVYLERIKQDGYATSSDYAPACIRLVDDYDLRMYDPKPEYPGEPDPDEADRPAVVTAEDAIAVIRGWIGRNEYDGSHKAIIDIYNSHRPLARGYALAYDDSWCDATVSAVFISLSAVDLIGGTECGVEEHIKLFKAAGIWIEDGSITPEPGDIITYNWDQSYQPNDGYADHIGIVEKVSGNVIMAIEGNRSNAVKRVPVEVGAGNIRGYARPKYGTSKPSMPPQQDPAEEDTGSGSGTLGKTVLWYGKVAKDQAKARTWAGIWYDQLVSIPTLYRDDPVGVCAVVKDDTAHDWYYARLDGGVFGFVDSSAIAKI